MVQHYIFLCQKRFNVLLGLVRVSSAAHFEIVTRTLKQRLLLLKLRLKFRFQVPSALLTLKTVASNQCTLRFSSALLSHQVKAFLSHVMVIRSVELLSERTVILNILVLEYQLNLIFSRVHRVSII